MPWETDIADFFRKNCDTFNAQIKSQEKELSHRFCDIYINLPPACENHSIVEEVVPLKRVKKISARDIVRSKKYVEDVFLDWDDYCLHHFVNNYEIDGVVHRMPPLGVWARKIKLNSHIFWIKDSVRREVGELFANFDRRLVNFTAHDFGIVAMFLCDCKTEGVEAALSIGYDHSRVVACSQGSVDCVGEFDFGIKKIIEALEKNFLLSFNLAQNIFDNYASFTEVPPAKEISIRDGSTYMNLSTNAINSFLKIYIKGQIEAMVSSIGGKVSAPFSLYFLGRLNGKEGFFSFVKELLPSQLAVSSLPQGLLSSSYGCIRYGLTRFLERGKSQTIREKIAQIYREYF